MRAAVLPHYDKDGTDLEIREEPIPVPEDDEVLVRIIAAAVNPLDNMIIRGEVKLIVPYKTPLVMGTELKRQGGAFPVSNPETGFTEECR